MRGSLTVCGLNESEQRAAECLFPHAGITGIVTTRQNDLADITHFMFRVFMFLGFFSLESKINVCSKSRKEKTS